MDYWKECISIAAEDCGAVLTDEQIEAIADSVRGGHENYGTAHGYDEIGCPAESQAQEKLRRLERQMEAQRVWEASSKPCPDCRAYGYVLDGWGRDQTCYRCEGKGRVPSH